jgi:type I restriction enzyme S subunit
MKAAIERFKSGSAQPQLPIKDLQKITFEIPQSDDVLATLDRQFVSIEERISFNNKEIDKQRYDRYLQILENLKQKAYR